MDECRDGRHIRGLILFTSRSLEGLSLITDGECIDWPINYMWFDTLEFRLDHNLTEIPATK
jgi:hypothetical protein